MSDTIPPNEEAAQCWVEKLTLQAKAESKKASIAVYPGPINKLIQTGIDELVARGFPDTVGGGNLMVAQQLVVEIEKINNS